MDAGFDHVTLVVEDLGAAECFFDALGFEKTQAVIVSGDVMSRYMGIPDWEADHVTLVHRDSSTHQEVQLLRFHTPQVRADHDAGELGRTGFNHVCLRVDDLDATLARLRTDGVVTRNDVMVFHDRRLVFVEGPAGVVIELAQWQSSPPVKPAATGEAAARRH